MGPILAGCAQPSAGADADGLGSAGVGSPDADASDAVGVGAGEVLADALADAVAATGAPRTHV
ncbi:MAG: hypothetical protein L0G22_03590, partial [Propionibacteriaceae bacterium]|nr:hypothetical protein [Propionibacteriaceae bacterium]